MATEGYTPTDYEGPWAGVKFNHPPEAAGLSLPRNCEHGSFLSPSMGTEVGFNVLLPPSYHGRHHDTLNCRASSRASSSISLAPRFPVVLYLHGRGDDENYQLLPSEGGFLESLTRAMESGAVPETIFVMGHSGRHAGYCDSVTPYTRRRTEQRAGHHAIMGETVITKELLPYVDTHYRTVPGDCALQGWSMGGQGALLLAFKHPTRFSSVVAMAPGLCTGQELLEELPQVFAVMHRRSDGPRGGEDVEADVALYDRTSAWGWVERNAEAIKKSGMGIRIICGCQDPQLYRSQRMHRVLNALNIKHEYEEVPGAGHDSGRVYPIHALAAMTWHHAHFRDHVRRVRARL